MITLFIARASKGNHLQTSCPFKSGNRDDAVVFRGQFRCDLKQKLTCIQSDLDALLTTSPYWNISKLLGKIK